VWTLCNPSPDVVSPTCVSRSLFLSPLIPPPPSCPIAIFKRHLLVYGSLPCSGGHFFFREKHPPGAFLQMWERTGCIWRRLPYRDPSFLPLGFDLCMYILIFFCQSTLLSDRIPPPPLTSVYGYPTSLFSVPFFSLAGG